MTGKRTTLAATLALALIVMALPASASDALVTEGTFQSFADGPGLGYEIEGTAVMVRTTDGRTIVRVKVSGLAAGVTYGSHVHNQACDDGNAGGHYRFDEPVPGGSLDGYEIWPGPFSANLAGIARGKAVVGAIAAPSARSVVIHAPGGAKIACADLS